MRPAVARACCLALSLFLTSCARKADPVEATKTFFGLIANGRSGEAYESTSLGFKAQQTEKRFAQTSKELGLVNVLSVVTEAPEFVSNTARLKIAITDKTGAKSSLTVTLVDERGAWRIFSVRAPLDLETGVAANLFGAVGKGRNFTDGVNNPMPTDAELRELIEATLLLFDESVKQGSFDGFYDEVSAAWQDEVSRAKLQSAFQGFIDQKISIAHIKDQPAIFYEPPAITTEGLLHARGYFAGEAVNVVFAFKFTYQTPKWRLSGLEVSLATPLRTEDRRQNE